VGFKRKKTIFTNKLDLSLRKKAVKCCNWALRKVDQKYLESVEMWCWRRMEKISWTDRVRNEVFHRVKKDRNVLHAI
jgi:hypothetical protein